MKPQILVTDTLFIFPEHEQKLQAAGFEIIREPRGNLSEDELAAALQGKIGYIIGGLEVVTPKVIDACGELKAIAFTGADWANFIPDHEAATKKGIKITNTPGTTMYPVAEFTLTLMLMMLRRVLQLGGPGKETFITTQSLAEAHVGIVGLGRIGHEVARILTALGAKKVSYWNRTRKQDAEAELGIEYSSLEDLSASCDVITNHVSSEAGELLSAKLLGTTKEGALFINCGGANSFNLGGLYTQITTKHARAAFDIHHAIAEKRFTDLPLSSWFCTNKNAGFNTKQMLQSTSDMAVMSIINVLTKGTDPHVVN